jgi:hypothetical protein
MSFLVNPYWYAQACADTDANAFLVAAGITDPIITSAICTLVTSMKADGTWAKMNAIYPMVGGTATTHKFNLKNPADTNAAFRLSFVGGWTHSANGALPNGTNAYADTFFRPSTDAIQNSHHLSYYSRSNINLNQVDIGSQRTLTQNLIQIRASNITYYVINQSSPYALVADLDSRGFYVANRTAVNVVNGWKNGLKVANATTVTNGRPNTTTFIGAYNLNGSPTLYSSKQCAFSTIGSGLTDAEALALYNSIQAFQTTLNRQI